MGWRRDEDEEDIWEGGNFNLYEFIKSGKEVPFDDFTDDVLDNLTYQYPSSRWEKGLGDDCKSTFSVSSLCETLIDSHFLSFHYLPGRAYLHRKNPDNDIAPTMAAAWCSMVNEDLEAMGRPRIDMVEIRTHRRRIAPPGSARRYAETGKEQSRYRFCNRK